MFLFIKMIGTTAAAAAIADHCEYNGDPKRGFPVEGFVRGERDNGYDPNTDGLH